MFRTPRAGVEFGDVVLTWYANQGDTPLVSPRGQLQDHIALSVGDLDAWVAKLHGEGVTLLEPPYRARRNARGDDRRAEQGSAGAGGGGDTLSGPARPFCSHICLWAEPRVAHRPMQNDISRRRQARLQSGQSS